MSNLAETSTRSHARNERTRTEHAARLRAPLGARSSVGERSLHTREVAGSKPAAPITRSSCIPAGFVPPQERQAEGRTCPDFGVGPFVGPFAGVATRRSGLGM